jgi:hypothetical protein
MSQYRWMRSLVAVSTLGAVAATGCFVVDDTDSDDDEENGGEDSGGSATRGGRGGSSGSANGGSSKGGSSTGGSSTGGSTNGGSTSGGSSSGTDAGGSSSGGAPPTGGSGGAPSGEAVMKFCNELVAIDQKTMEEIPVELTVVFAGVEATALSGECTPVVPTPCITIPAAAMPTVSLLDDTGATIVSGSFPTLTVADGDEILVVALFDDGGTPTVPEDDGPGVQAGAFLPEYVCAETDPLAPVMSRSIPFGLPFAKSARHGLKRSVSREARAALPAYRFGPK